MPKAHTTWTVLPHGPLEPLAENLWRVTGTLPKMSLGRVFTIARRTDGNLVFHNPIALSEDVMRAVEELGRPAFVLVPNGWHRLDARVFKDRYPDVRVLCPDGATSRVSQVVRVDGSYDAFPSDDAVRLSHLDGVGRAEGVMEVRSADGVTLAFNDVVFNQPHLPGLFGLVYRALGSTGGPKVTPLLRLFIVKDRAELKANLTRLAEIPDLRRIVVMHGDMISGDAAGTLRQVAETLA